MKILVSILAVSIFTIAAQAQLSQIGAIALAGTGCSNDTVSTRVSGSTITIAYHAFKIQSEARTTVARTSCAIAVPFNVPAGFQLMAAASTNGVSRLHGTDRAKVTNELFFAGDQSPRQQLSLSSSDRYFTLGRITPASAITSSCGESVNLRANVSAQAVLPVDSTSKVEILKTQVFLKLVPCQAR